MSEYETFRPPVNEATIRAGKFFREISKTDDYAFARSCKHCTDTADSFNRYVSTYCHLQQRHIAFPSDINYLKECKNCKFYKKRG